MHLKASRVLYPDRLIEVNIADCESMSEVEVDKAWRNVFLNSIATKGMLNPILVCTEERLKKDLHKIFRGPFEYTGHKYRVFTGNNRFHFARENGYTSIDAYELKSCKDWDKLNEKTFLEAKDM